MAKTKKNETGANLGFEAKSWLTADKMRNNMDAAEYKHVVLGLIFLKYISDAFEEHHQQLEKGTAAPNNRQRQLCRVQHFIHHLAPDGFVLADGSTSSRPYFGSGVEK